MPRALLITITIAIVFAAHGCGGEETPPDYRLKYEYESMNVDNSRFMPSTAFCRNAQTVIASLTVDKLTINCNWHCVNGEGQPEPYSRSITIELTQQEDIFGNYFGWSIVNDIILPQSHETCTDYVIATEVY